MKELLKSVMVCVALIVWGLTVSGCGHDKHQRFEDDRSKEVTQTSETNSNDTVPLNHKDSNSVLDSPNDVSGQIEGLTQYIYDQDKAIKSNESEIKKLRRDSGLSILIVLCIGIASLIISILALLKTKRVNKRIRRHRQEIEELKHSLSAIEARFENAIRNIEIKASRNRGQESSDLALRVHRIECRLAEGLRPVPANSRRDGVKSDNNVPLNEQKGYFDLPKQKSPTEAYFKCLFDSRTSDTCFRVVVKNEIADFYPLEGARFINDIQSYDTIKFVLDIQGVLPSEAKQMRVIMPGEAKLVGDNWEITRKAKIELSK